MQLIKNKEVFISCVVPVYNEEKLISSFMKELEKTLSQLSPLFEIIIIDDGSRDKTVDIVRTYLHSSSHIKLLSFSRNFGKETALMAGLDHAAGDVVILMDADFQHPLAMLPVFFKKWTEGFDMVYGVRQNRKKESCIKRNFANLFYWLMSKITHITIPNHAGDFRLLDRKVVNALNHIKERSRYMKGLYAWVGFNSIGIPFEVENRPSGKSRWGFLKLADLAMTGIVSFSDIPLRVWGWIGFVISSISLIYAIYIITVTLMFGTDLPGFPTIVVAVMFLGGIQLLSIGVLGEYIARIFNEVKQRPNYIINIKEGF